MPGNLRPQVQSVLNTDQAVITLEGAAKIDNLSISCLTGGTGEATTKAAVKITGNLVDVKRCLINNSESDGIFLAENSAADIIETTIENIPGEGLEAVSGSNLIMRDCRIIGTGGTGIWATNSSLATVENCVIYNTGWHGIDFNNCLEARIEHCTIVDFSNNDDGQSGIMASNGGTLVVKSNLIQISTIPSLIGVDFENTSGSIFLYNYIYSEQTGGTNYYGGDLSIDTVDTSNLPNIESPNTNDPLLDNPPLGLFGLDPDNSPARFVGEGGTPAGAQGSVLEP